MKVLYLAEWDVSEDSGVKEKILSQADQWAKFGVNVNILFISPSFKRIDSRNVSVLSSKWLSKVKYSFIKTYLNKILLSNKIVKHISLFDPDLIYFRQSIWHPCLEKVSRSTCSVMELNSLDLFEIKHTSTFKQFIYKFGRNKLMKSCDGFIAVSNEIKETVVSFGKPVEVIANGIDFSRFSKVDDSNPHYLDRRAKIVFCGSPNQAWHGVDKIVCLARNLKEFDFHIVGPEGLMSENDNNIFFHGYMRRKDIFHLYNDMDVAIGTLALHRKNMSEASPLKTREYAAFGLPMIIGYTDTDLREKPFILNIGNYANNVVDNIEIIRNFVIKYAGYRYSMDKVDVISSCVKERKRINFFNEICKK